MLECTNCGALFGENELSRVAIGKKEWHVCPECLEAFCEEMEGTVKELSTEEEWAIRAEWDADERHDGRRVI